MSEKRIEIGDTVYVMYPGHGSNTAITERAFTAKVLNIPRATGDSWIFEAQQYGGEIYYVSEPITVALTKKANTDELQEAGGNE